MSDKLFMHFMHIGSKNPRTALVALLFALNFIGCVKVSVSPISGTTQPSVAISKPVFSQGSYSVMPNESVQTAATGGTAPYVFADSGSGFMSPLGIYTPAIGSSANTETVTVTDAQNAIGSASVRTVAFTDISIASAGTAPFSSKIRDAAYDSTGKLWAVGEILDLNGVAIWVTAVSADDGLTWTTKDVYSLPGKVKSPISVLSWTSSAKAVGISAAGVIYVAGMASDAFGQWWVVRRSADSGSTWTTVDQYRETPTPLSPKFDKFSAAWAIAFGSGNTVYVGGSVGTAGSADTLPKA